MSYLLTQMFLYLLVAFLLGLLLGWLIWRYGKSSTGDLDGMRAERDAMIRDRDALANERDALQTNLDDCRNRSAQQRDALNALEAEKASWEATPAPVAVPAVAAVASAAAVSTTASKPQGLTAARDGKPDNLQDISGVGPKMEKMLNKLGYFHFDQIADWTKSEVSWVDDNLEGFKGRVTRDNWQPQAKKLTKR